MTRTLAIVAAAVSLLSIPSVGRAQTAAAAKPGEVALVGCVELERDYRARKESGRGGALGSGVGVSNEFVLSNARPAPARGQAVGTSGGGTDYSLTGKMEKDFLRHVGRQVEVVGTIEKTESGLERLNVTLWHPVGDYCPAKQ